MLSFAHRSSSPLICTDRPFAFAIAANMWCVHRDADRIASRRTCCRTCPRFCPTSARLASRAPSLRGSGHEASGACLPAPERSGAQIAQNANVPSYPRRLQIELGVRQEVATKVPAKPYRTTRRATPYRDTQDHAPLPYTRAINCKQICRLTAHISLSGQSSRASPH